MNNGSLGVKSGGTSVHGHCSLVTSDLQRRPMWRRDRSDQGLQCLNHSGSRDRSARRTWYRRSSLNYDHCRGVGVEVCTGRAARQPGRAGPRGLWAMGRIGLQAKLYPKFAYKTSNYKKVTHAKSWNDHISVVKQKVAKSIDIMKTY